MTPEERARDMRIVCARDHGSWKLDTPCSECVVSAIRAAENEALERAAERLARTMVTRQDVVLWAIETVRSLKHPEAP